MYVKLLAITQPVELVGAQELIEYCGRISHRSEMKDSGKFIRSVLNMGHESVVEHVSATFEIGEISRACSHQIVRHRIASFTQESQRYVDQSNVGFVVPHSIADNDKAAMCWIATSTAIDNAYADMLRCGVPKEDARFILPQAAMTRLVLTMNFRELLHFFRLRLDEHAQWEIRAVASEMLRLIRPYAPEVFSEFA